MKPKKFAIRKGKVVLVPMKRKKKKSLILNIIENKKRLKQIARDYDKDISKNAYAYWKPKKQKQCPNCNITLFETQSSCELCGWTEQTRHISKLVKNDVWNRDGGKCVECGSNERLEFDHIISYSKGGSNTARNIQLLCEKCNRSKYNKIQ